MKIKYTLKDRCLMFKCATMSKFWNALATIAWKFGYVGAGMDFDDKAINAWECGWEVSIGM